ncbi:MAG: hypothetical protein V3V31_03145 [Methylococcales bacterium]
MKIKRLEAAIVLAGFLAVSTQTFAVGTLTLGDLPTAQGDSDPDYIEAGMRLNSLPFDNGTTGSHIHGAADFDSNRVFMQFHGDSAGFFLKEENGGKFSFDSFELVSSDFRVLNSGGTAVTGETTVEVRGYSDADGNNAVQGAEFTLDSTLQPRAASQSVVSIDLPDTFSDIALVEFWFSDPGRGVDPGASQFGQAYKQIGVDLDTFKTSEASVVPIPAAVYFFGVGLTGLFSLARRRGVRIT